MPQCIRLCPWKFLGWFNPCVGPASYPSEQPTGFDSVHGMKALCDLVNRSEATVLDWIRARDFPASLVEGEWTADRCMVVNWMMKEIWKCD